MTTAKDILTRLAEQNHNVPEEAYRAICLFNEYISRKTPPIFLAIIQRSNHGLDRAEIFIDVPSGYINLSNFSVQTHGKTNTCTGKALTWIKSLNGVYTLKIFTIDPITVRESGYYE